MNQTADKSTLVAVTLVATMIVTVVVAMAMVGITFFIMILMAVMITVVLFFGIEVLGSVFLPFAVLPRVALTGDEGKHTGHCKSAENDLFHVRHLHNPSPWESKASLCANFLARILARHP